MKIIKSFESYNRLYEELDPSTYRKAGEELMKIGHVNRGTKLINHADKKNWLNLKNEYSKFGAIEVTLIGKSSLISRDPIDIECYPFISFDMLNDEGPLNIGLIPTKEKDLDVMCTYLGKDINNCGFSWFSYLDERGYYYSDEEKINIEIANRVSAVKLRKLLIDIFNGNLPDYPDFNNIEEDIKEKFIKIVNDLSVNKMYEN